MTNPIRYYEIIGPSGRNIANFLDRALAEEQVKVIRKEHEDEVRRKIDEGTIVTGGERRGELSYAKYGVRVVERVIRFSDDDV